MRNKCRSIPQNREGIRPGGAAEHLPASHVASLLISPAGAQPPRPVINSQGSASTLDLNLTAVV